MEDRFEGGCPQPPSQPSLHSPQLLTSAKPPRQAGQRLDPEGQGLLHGAPGSASFSSQAAGVSKLGRGQLLLPVFQADSKSQWGRGLRVVGSRTGWKSAGPCRSGLKSMSVFLGSDPGLSKTGACALVQVSEELLDEAQITLGAHPRAFQDLLGVARVSGGAQSWGHSFEPGASAKPTKLAGLLLARGLSFPICPEHETCGSQY